MALDDYSYDIDNSEWLWNSSEKASESVSEKIRESIKKWASWIKRTQKDEKKAKKYDFLLANSLVKIIINKKYDSIVENIFKVMDFWYASNFILWVLSLINTDISDKIREISWKEKIKFDFISDKEIEFDDSNLNKEIKDRINLWIEDIIDATSIEYSNVQNSKNLKMLEKNDTVIVIFMAQVFAFFLKESNITIKKSEAKAISYFIKTTVEKILKDLKIDEV